MSSGHSIVTWMYSEMNQLLAAYFQTHSVESSLCSQTRTRPLINLRLLYDIPQETPLTRGTLKVCSKDGWS